MKQIYIRGICIHFDESFYINKLFKFPCSIAATEATCWSFALA